MLECTAGAVEGPFAQEAFIEHHYVPDSTPGSGEAGLHESQLYLRSSESESDNTKERK